MSSIALWRFFSLQKMQSKLAANIVLTLQAAGLLLLICVAAVISVTPQMHITMNFCLLGFCLVSTMVLLTNGLKDEAGTSIWMGAIMAALVSADLEGLVPQALMLVFAGACLWLMWYVTPWPRTEEC